MEVEKPGESNKVPAGLLRVRAGGLRFRVWGLLRTSAKVFGLEVDALGFTG